MKTEDFDRLKQICDENGFEFHVTDRDGEQLSIIVQKKDPWEGVEFFECDGEIIKFGSYDKQKNILVASDGDWCHETTCKPSTEQAYIEQLKQQAFERFGEIKEGDRFDFNLASITIDSGTGFLYYKIDDSLCFNDWIIYKQGKWATKIEKVEVEYWGCNVQDLKNRIISFRLHNAENINIIEITKQLTKYLKNERPD